nr:pyridoxal-phosphate dependent enzyme [Bacteroidota bacterium]
MKKFNEKPIITSEEIRNAYQQIRDQIFKTPLVYSPELSKISGARVYLKMEHLQYTGSFKIRGVLTKINTLSPDDFSRTFVAASTGNHAAAFAHVSQKNNLRSVLFLPDKTSPAKIRAIGHYDIDIRHFGANSMETESKAREYAGTINGVLIHPYNDRDIIKGQGTIGVEIKNQWPEADTIIAPIGGGGLISGLCCFFGSGNGVKVIGCQPENAAEMYHSLKKGHIIEPSELDTIADATAGGLEEGSITFDICKKSLPDIELCTEGQIRQAVAFLVKYHQTIVEPGAALSVATLMNSQKYRGKNVVLVLTGKKINLPLLTEILSTYGNDY